MLNNYVLTTFRNILKHRLFSFINIAGLSIGMAAVMLILLFVQDEMSFDRFWDNSNQIYRLHSISKKPGSPPFKAAIVPWPAKDALLRHYPADIDFATRFRRVTPTLEYEGKVFSETVYWTDPDTINIFSLKTLKGDLGVALNDTASMAVSDSFSKKHFGDKNPINQIVTMTYKKLRRSYKVAAVFQDLPHNTVLNFQALTMINENDLPGAFDSWDSYSGPLYFKLKGGANIQAVKDQLINFVDTNITTKDGRKASDTVEFSVMPLTDIQLNATNWADWGVEMKPVGDMITVIIFTAIAGLILLIACFNFINLSTAKFTQRGREVALRKVLGARRQQIIFQFLGESLMIALISLILGMVLVELVLPIFNDFLNRPLTIDYSGGLTLLILSGMVITVGFMAGIYPALVLSGFLPSRILRGTKSPEASGSAKIRNALVVLQFSISISLIISTTAIYSQLNYVENLDPGYNKENMLVVKNMRHQDASSNQQAFKNEILRLPEVLNATYTWNVPSNGSGGTVNFEVPDQPTPGPIRIGVQGMDHDFLRTYGIDLLAGRTYDPTFNNDGIPSLENIKTGIVPQGTIIINEAAMKRFGFGSPEKSIGRNIRMSQNGPTGPTPIDLKVIGVIPDISFQSLRTQVRPETYWLVKKGEARYLTVRFTKETSTIVPKVNDLWKNLMPPSVPFSYEFIGETLALEFTGEGKFGFMLTFFALLAVVIAALGLYGLASFSTERRTKEIGIRKVLGARVRDIVQLLVWQFSKPVFLANLIAWPLATWWILSWLETFPFRMDSWVLLPLSLASGLLALLIAWVTVASHALSVARTNPINALRAE